MEKNNLKTNIFEFFLAYNTQRDHSLFCDNTPRPPMSVHKNFSSIGPGVWPAIGNIYVLMSCFYIDTS